VSRLSGKVEHAFRDLREQLSRYCEFKARWQVLHLFLKGNHGASFILFEARRPTSQHPPYVGREFLYNKHAITKRCILHFTYSLELLLKDDRHTDKFGCGMPEMKLVFTKSSLEGVSDLADAVEAEACSNLTAMLRQLADVVDHTATVFEGLEAQVQNRSSASQHSVLGLWGYQSGEGVPDLTAELLSEYFTILREYALNTE
jgi:hypothetical protein